jgi:thiol-disulfide isomerase/thioredoxin
MQLRQWLVTTLCALLFVTACGAPAAPEAAMPEKPTEQSAMSDSQAMTETMAMTDTHAMTDSMMMTETHAMTDSMMMTETHAMTESAAAEPAMMMELLPWQTMALTNTRTGEPFTLADFAGKTVFVETMATWCPNCRQQLTNVKSAAARANPETTVFVAISVETDLPPATLAQYADDNGFDWTFAVATPEMVQALAETFGQTVANPPATPHFLILPDGAHSDLVTGFESGDQILANIGQ